MPDPAVAHVAPDKIDRFLAMGDPWPTTDVLAKLVEAAEHLLHGHGCDAHGWEEVEHAARVGRERLEALGVRIPERFSDGQAAR